MRSALRIIDIEFTPINLIGQLSKVSALMNDGSKILLYHCIPLLDPIKKPELVGLTESDAIKKIIHLADIAC